MPCWYYEKEDLESTPSIKDGIDPSTEARYRREGARFIIEAGTTQGLRFDTMATGVVYFHRFYMFHSFKEFPRYVMGAACLFLAGKVEETPKKCKDIIKIAKNILPEAHFAAFGDDPKEEIMTYERILLQTIKFDLQVEHPYSYLLKFAKTFKGDKDKIQKLVQMAWTFVNDSLCTILCLQWEPHIVAVAFLYLAGRLSKSDLMDWSGKSTKVKWWEQLTEDVSLDIMEEICHKLLDLYAAGQHKGTPYTPPKALGKRPKQKLVLPSVDGESSHGDPKAKVMKQEHTREKQRAPPPPPPSTQSAPPTMVPHELQSAPTPPPPPRAQSNAYASNSTQIHHSSVSQPPPVPHQAPPVQHQPPPTLHQQPPAVHQPPPPPLRQPPISVSQPAQPTYQAPYQQAPSFTPSIPVSQSFGAPSYNTPPYSGASAVPQTTPQPTPQSAPPTPSVPIPQMPPVSLPGPQPYQQQHGQFQSHSAPTFAAPPFGPPPVSSSQPPQYQQPPPTQATVHPPVPPYRPAPPSNLSVTPPVVSQSGAPSIPPPPLQFTNFTNRYQTSNPNQSQPPTSQFGTNTPVQRPAAPPSFPPPPANMGSMNQPQNAPPPGVIPNFPPPTSSQMLPNAPPFSQSMLNIAQNFAAQQLQNLGVPRGAPMPPMANFVNQQQQSLGTQPGGQSGQPQGGFSTGLATVRITGREVGRRPSHGGGKRKKFTNE